MRMTCLLFGSKKLQLPSLPPSRHLTTLAGSRSIRSKHNGTTETGGSRRRREGSRRRWEGSRRRREGTEGEIGEEIAVAPKDFERGPWMGPMTTYGRGKRHRATYTEVVALAHGVLELETSESALVVLAEDEPENYKQAMKSTEEAKWREAC